MAQELPAAWSAARTLASQGHHDPALNHLRDLEKKGAEGLKKSQIHLLMGKIYLEKGLYDFALTSLESARTEGTVLEDYLLYLRGEVHKRRSDLDSAKSAYSEALTHSPSSRMKQLIELALADLHFQRKEWAAARTLYVGLERVGTNQTWHAEVLHRLIQIEWSLNANQRACRWAQEIYWRYPSDPLIYSWGMDLQKNKVGSKSVGCMAQTRDQERRIRRLQLAGESEKALTELKILQERTTKSLSYMADKMLAEHYIQEGYVKEALEILLAHYEAKKSDYDYLMLLARGASRAGEFQTAVGAYDKAHEVAKGGYNARRALFQAAFLSYQFQDYDGAGRKFEVFRKKYPTSGLSRDSQWHLAWIKYLKGDFVGAEKDFQVMLNQRRGTRAWRQYPKERISYWQGMSLMRMGNIERARGIFEDLARKSSESYYAVAAESRLRSFPEIPSSRTPSGEVSTAALGEIVLAQGQGAPKTEESESEDSLALDEDLDGAVEDEASEGWVNVGDAAPPEEVVQVTEFRDPSLAARFEKARAFRELGENVLARWELSEIERRTSNKDYRRMLVAEYQSVEEFYRSAYMATVYFRSEREQYGIQGVRYLWEQAFPKAYENYVTLYSRSFSVPRELIWSIMRAETYYRKEAVSPVGALGLMQVMPNTGRNMARLMNIKGFEPETLLEPEMAIRLGASYLRRVLKKFEDRPPLAAAAYNAGPHRVYSWIQNFGELEMDEFIEHIPFLETRNYVKKVVGYYKIYGALYDQSGQSFAWLSQPVGVEAPGPAPTRENWDVL